MSAYFAQKLEDRVVILSDAAHYDRELIIRRIHSKIYDLGAFNAVSVSRGDMNVGVAMTNALRTIFASARTFDLAIHGARAGFAMIDGSREQKPFEIIIAGWSETKGPSLYAFTNRKVEGIEPFVLHEIETAVSNGYVPDDDDMAGLAARGGIDVFAVDWFNLMRQAKTTPITADGTEGYIVGGFIERADITAAGLSKEIVHRWPDVVGRKIEIAEHEAVAA